MKKHVAVTQMTAVKNGRKLVPVGRDPVTNAIMDANGLELEEDDPRQGSLGFLEAIIGHPMPQIKIGPQKAKTEKQIAAEVAGAPHNRPMEFLNPKEMKASRERLFELQDEHCRVMPYLGGGLVLGEFVSLMPTRGGNANKVLRVRVDEVFMGKDEMDDEQQATFYMLNCSGGITGGSGSARTTGRTRRPPS